MDNTAYQALERLDKLLAALDPALDWMIDPHSGKMFEDVEAMIKQSGFRGSTQFLRQVKALHKERKMAAAFYNETRGVD